MDSQNIAAGPAHGRLTPHVRKQVIAVSDVAEATLRRWELGQPIRDASRVRIERALESVVGDEGERRHG